MASKIFITGLIAFAATWAAAPPLAQWAARSQVHAMQGWAEDSVKATRAPQAEPVVERDAECTYTGVVVEGSPFLVFGQPTAAPE